MRTVLQIERVGGRVGDAEGQRGHPQAGERGDPPQPEQVRKRRDQRGPRGFDGVAPSPFDIRCKSSGDRVLLACPALIGGLTKIDDDIGIVPAYGSWVG